MVQQDHMLSTFVPQGMPDTYSWQSPEGWLPEELQCVPCNSSWNYQQMPPTKGPQSSSAKEQPHEDVLEKMDEVPETMQSSNGASSSGEQAHDGVPHTVSEAAAICLDEAGALCKNGSKLINTAIEIVDPLESLGKVVGIVNTQLLKAVDNYEKIQSIEENVANVMAKAIVSITYHYAHAPHWSGDQMKMFTHCANMLDMFAISIRTPRAGFSLFSCHKASFNLLFEKRLTLQTIDHKFPALLEVCNTLNDNFPVPDFEMADVVQHRIQIMDAFSAEQFCRVSKMFHDPILEALRAIQQQGRVSGRKLTVPCFGALGHMISGPAV